MIRFRTVVVLLSLMSFIFVQILVAKSTYSLLAVMSPLSNDSLLLSELLPRLPEVATIGVRLATFVGALILITLTTIIWSRRDSYSFLNKVSASSVLLVLGVVLWGGAYTLNAIRYDTVDRWREFHYSIEYTQNMDVSMIKGTVDIVPDRHLMIDLMIEMELVELTDNQLIFSLNPGMHVAAIELNGTKTGFISRNGLLIIDVLPKESTHEQLTLRVKASGKPDSRFAYLDSAVDLLRSAGIPPRAVKMFGRDASIFNSRFVVLMPGIAWYPIAGTMTQGVFGRSKKVDFFNIDLGNV